MTRPAPINLHECSQGLRYYHFVVNLDIFVGSCNTFSDLSHKMCVPIKTEDLNDYMIKPYSGWGLGVDKNTPEQFFPVTSTNVGIISQNFLI